MMFTKAQHMQMKYDSEDNLDMSKKTQRQILIRQLCYDK